MTVENLAEIAEKIYFDNPRLNSRRQLTEIVSAEFAAQGLAADAVLDMKAVYDMVIDRANNPRIGEFLEIEHSRKGKFIIQVSKVSEEWIDGVIVTGTAKAVMDYNVKFEGEEISCRRSLCFFYPIRPVKLAEKVCAEAKGKFK